MKNLENYGVLQMNAQEMRETDGGFPWLILGIVAIVTVIGSSILNNETQNCNDDPNCTTGSSGGGGGSGLVIMADAHTL